MASRPRIVDLPATAVAVLVVVTLTAGFLLGATDAATRERIAELKKAKEEAVMRAALGGPTELAEQTASDAAGEFSYYVGRKDGEVLGHSYTVQTKGYGGLIEAAVAVDAVGAVRKVVILSQSETPGLGAKIGDERFLSQFVGKKGADTGLELSKLGGEIDAVTGATISSRAVLAAVKDALALEERRRTSTGAGPTKGGG